jgi:hypothetical protein
MNRKTPAYKQSKINKILDDLQRTISKNLETCGQAEIEGSGDRLSKQIAALQLGRCRRDATAGAIESVLGIHLKKCLGDRNDYEVVYDAKGNPWQARPIKRRDRSIWHIADVLPAIMNEHIVDVDDALLVAGGLIGIAQRCSLPVGVPPYRFLQPRDAAMAESLLKDAVEQFFMDRARSSVDGLSLAGSLVSLKKQLDIEADKWKGWNDAIITVEKKTYYAKALEILIEKIEMEISWQLEANKVSADLGETLNRSDIQETHDKFDPMKRGLTRQLAMLLLDELFPNLNDASNKARQSFYAY